jgi:pyridoxal phosphate enzyme (YggS family)
MNPMSAAAHPGAVLESNLRRIQERVAAAAGRAGRPADSVTLVAVTKLVTPDIIKLLPGLGIQVIGENRVQAALEKQSALVGTPLRWHLIGSLQKNKAKKAAAAFDCVQSVDSLALAEVLAAGARERGRRLPVLVQVNIGREPQKSGVAPEAAAALVEQVASLADLDLRGLMGIAPIDAEEPALRGMFASLRGLLPERAGAGRELSMGMSDDFEIAIEEGATMIRVGRALFEGTMVEHS